MTTDHTELCERLRQASIQCSDCGMYETSSDFDLAVSTIESQAARIADLENECAALIHDNARLLRIATAEANAASEALEASKAVEAAAIERCAKFMEARADEIAAAGNCTANMMAAIYRDEANSLRALLPKEES